jgi:hypothetical protein
MMMKRQTKTLALAMMSSLVVVLAGCNAMVKSVSEVRQGVACRQISEPGLTLVKDPVIKRVGGGLMVSDQSLKPEDEERKDDKDFWLVRVDMGEQPSGGYRLELLSDKLTISEDTARFSLQWVKPDPDTMQPQVLIYPCIFLKVAKGDYTRLEVVDETGRLRHGIDLP